LARGWNCIGVKALPGKLKLGCRINADAVQWMVFGTAAPWIGVELQFNELAYGRGTIAGYDSGFTACCGNDAITDHEKPMLVAEDESLHQHGTALIHCNTPGCFNFVAG
jgi:hypothetical protein